MKGASLSRIDAIRAWKDPKFRNTLSEAELKDIPTHPAGVVDLSETQFAQVLGASNVGILQTGACHTVGCCGGASCYCDTAHCSQWGCYITGDRTYCSTYCACP